MTEISHLTEDILNTVEEFEEEIDLDEYENDDFLNEIDEDLGDCIDDEVQMLLQNVSFPQLDFSEDL